MCWDSLGKLYLMDTSWKQLVTIKIKTTFKYFCFQRLRVQIFYNLKLNIIGFELEKWSILSLSESAQKLLWKSCCHGNRSFSNSKDSCEIRSLEICHRMGRFNIEMSGKKFNLYFMKRPKKISFSIHLGNRF